MDSILNLLTNAENVRMLVILAFVYVGYVRINLRMDRMEYSLNKRIDGVETSINELRITMDARMNELKFNDFAHLSSAFEALTYVLEKNGSLSKEDKEYVDARLAH